MIFNGTEMEVSSWGTIQSLIEAREKRAHRRHGVRAEVLEDLVARDLRDQLEAILATDCDDDWLDKT